MQNDVLYEKIGMKLEIATNDIDGVECIKLILLLDSLMAAVGEE